MARQNKANNTTEKEDVSWRERFAALGNLPAFFRLVWQTSPGLFLGNAVLRLIRAAVPATTLYVGKLIIDQVVLLSRQPGPD
ncbi:MAG: ABC transporter ATP-binding protein, partial [Cytophagaceae bacterium]